MVGWLLLVALAQPRFDVEGFTRPLEVDGPRPSRCAECHPQVAAEWSRSAHHHSLTNPVFLDGFDAEPHRRCLVCHAPLASQVRDAVSASARGALRQLPADSPAHDGIGCVVCHVRDGEVLTPSPARPYGHPVRHAPQLREPAFCATCHEFTGHVVRDGVTTLNRLPLQTTYTEWRRWGGAQTCQACHMPAGSHVLLGPRHPEFLRAAVTLTVEGGLAVVRSVGVGHLLPTGDVFRHLVLWADDAPLATFGLTLQPAVDDAGVPGLAVTRDTRLAPSVPARVRIPAGAQVLRLTYHLTAPSPRLRRGLTREDEVLPVHELRLR